MLDLPLFFVILRYDWQFLPVILAMYKLLPE